MMYINIEFRWVSRRIETFSLIFFTLSPLLRKHFSLHSFIISFAQILKECEPLDGEEGHRLTTFSTKICYKVSKYQVKGSRFERSRERKNFSFKLKVNFLYIQGWEIYFFKLHAKLLLKAFRLHSKALRAEQKFCKSPSRMELSNKVKLLKQSELPFVYFTMIISHRTKRSLKGW